MGVRRYRYRKIRFATSLMDDILRGTIGRVDPCQLPADLRVVGVEQPRHAVGDYFFLILHSMNFKAIRSSEAIPEIDIKSIGKPIFEEERIYHGKF